jgi:hypothetical protein
MTAAAESSSFLSFLVSHISHSVGNSIASDGNESSNLSILPSVSLDQLLNSSTLLGWPAMLAADQAKQIFVKIDIEGNEAIVLNGMDSLLMEQRLRKVIDEVNPERTKLLDQDLNIDQMMASYGYSPTIQSAGRPHFDQCYLPNA